jgi:uncharacterized membrane protein
MKKIVSSIVFILAAVLMWFLPDSGNPVAIEGNTVRGTVVNIDNSQLTVLGLLEYGTQALEVELSDGMRYRAMNELRAQMELDKKFNVGDRVLLVLPMGIKDISSLPKDAILIARDFWRINMIAITFLAFALLLCVFGGWTGAKALFSFVFSALAIWKILIPLSLSGYSASIVSFFTVSVLTFVIMYLVGGPTRKAASAFLGAMSGVVASLVITYTVAHLINVDGKSMAYALTLKYGGYSFLDLRDIFVGAVILASSGAVMDLAMDIASGVEEVKLHNPSLSFKELTFSGIRIGRAVVGTMTTTLLLAYSGGYLTLLMSFAAHGTHPVDFVNSALVASEIAKTLAGSFGLVLVAPFTAVVAGWMFSRGEKLD